MNQWHDSFSETHLVKSNWLWDVLFSSLRKKLSAVYLILQTFYKKKNLHKKYLYSFRIIRFFRVNGATQAIFGASGKIPAAKDLLNENLSVSFDRLIFYVWVYVTRELSKYSMTKFPRYTSLMESLFSKLQTYSRQLNSKKTLSHIFPCKL